jgi:SOS response regulatory protein OraA/RecX
LVQNREHLQYKNLRVSFDLNLYETTLNKIINFLSYSQRSRKEVSDRIYQYLRKKDISDEEKESIRDKVIAELEKLKLLDDISYVQNYIDGRLRIAKPMSKRKIYEFLYKKGIEREVIEKELQIYSEETEFKFVRELAEKKLPNIRGKDKRTIKMKLIKYLFGKGFSPDVVYPVIDDLNI